jgi:hypothetical protein
MTRDDEFFPNERERDDDADDDTETGNSADTATLPESIAYTSCPECGGRIGTRGTFTTGEEAEVCVFCIREDRCGWESTTVLPSFSAEPDGRFDRLRGR